MHKKKIIIISLTFYPRQSPRALRATELAKELAARGHDVTVYASLGIHNYVAFENKYKLKVRSIGKMYFETFNSDGQRKNSFVVRVLTKIFGRLLEFPGIELMFRIPGIIRKEENIDQLITIAIPYPIHWGTALARVLYPKKFPKVWIADCGDPYMGNEFHKPLFYFKYIEKWFCRKADYITIPIKGAIKGYYKEFHHKIRIIPQGFNFEEAYAIVDNKHVKNEVLTFAYAGAFYRGIRDPSLLLEYLEAVSMNFKFIIYTQNKEIMLPFLETLKDKIEIRDYIPREELLKVLSQMDFVVNFENGTDIQSPSKLIDYALINKPILSVNSIFLEKEKIDAFLNRDYKDSLVIENIEQYNIKNVANEFLYLK